MGEYEGGYTSINLSLRACHQPPVRYFTKYFLHPRIWSAAQLWSQEHLRTRALPYKGRERGIPARDQDGVLLRDLF